MIEAFFQWWLVTHDVWSTIMTPALSFLWAIFTENTVRAWIAGLIWVFSQILEGFITEVCK
jgi:hypothetical protein